VLVAVHSCCIVSGHCCSCVKSERTSCSSAAHNVGTGVEGRCGRQSADSAACCIWSCGPTSHLPICVHALLHGLKQQWQLLLGTGKGQATGCSFAKRTSKAKRTGKQAGRATTC